MFGITVFILIPAYVFSIIEEWSYLDAIYFSVISLTKVGFGDYVPRTHPPDSYATYRHTESVELETFATTVMRQKLGLFLSLLFGQMSEFSAFFLNLKSKHLLASF